MTRSEVLSYPLMMVASAALLVWTVLASAREATVSSLGVYEQIAGVMLLLVGLTVCAALDHLARRQGSTKRVARAASFNPTLIHEVIHVHFDVPGHMPIEAGGAEITSADLVGHDNSLALAKLRLDLEQALRELALGQGVQTKINGTGARKMAELLAERGILPPELVGPIRQIMDVCNQAIHGYEVSNELAESVVSVGDELLIRLRWLIDSGTGAPRASTTAKE